MADYAISNVPRRVVYAASGTGPYAFTFEILNQTDIAVYKASTLLTLTTDYTVTINANGTGSVTLVTTAGTSNITIVGAKNIQRTTDFTTGGDLFANTLNDELDNQTIFIQQVAETAERGLKAPVVDPTDINMTLPAKASRVGTVLAFNATTGNPEAGPSIASVTTVAAQSANINTVATNIGSVNTVAGNTSNINTVAGVSGNVTAVATNIANVNAVGSDLLEATSEINTVAVDIANVNAVGNNISNVNTVATNNSNVTTVAGISGNVTTVAGISGAVSNVSSISSAVSGVNANEANVNTVAGQITPTNNVSTVAGISANVSTVAGISANVTSVAGNASNINTVAGISGNVTTVATNNANVTTVAGISANVTTVANNSANVTIAATNVADINNFADVYQGAKATDPTLRNDGSALQPGDLYFNTTDDVMKVREGGAWLAAFASLSGALIAANNLSDVASASAARTNLGLGTGNTPTFTGVIAGAGTVSAPAITTTGDTNTGIFFPAADTIAFTEGGVESMRVDSAGNLGVGTSSPAYRLDAIANLNSSLARINIQNTNAGSSANAILGVGNDQTSTAGGIKLGSSTWTSGSNAMEIFNNLNAPIFFSNNGAERMRIDSAGNLGVGTTSPAARLHVSGATRVADSSDSANRITIGVGANAPYGNASISTTTAGLAIVAEGAGNVTFLNNGSERMRIDSNGNLGLGVAPQTWYLNSSVYGALQFGAGALFYGRTTSSSVNLEISTNSYLDSSAAYRYLFTGEASRYNQASGAHIWSSAVSGTAGNSFSYTERMRLTADGLLQFNSGYGSVATAYGCRAWVNFNGTGTVAIRASGNVSSITDNGTGNFTVNFTTAMPNANYSVSATASTAGTTASYTHVVTTGDSDNVYGGFSTTSVRLNAWGANYGSLGDPNYVMACIFR